MMSLAGVYAGKADGSVKVPVALEKTLLEHEKIRKVYLHFDRDDAGRRAAKGLSESLSGRVTVRDEPPGFGKDFNDYLCMVCKSSVRKRERNDRYER